IRQWHVSLEELDSDGIESRRRNLGVRERLTCQWVIGPTSGTREITPTFGLGRRNGGGEELRLPDPHALVRPEEEGSIADCGSAEREAELVLLEIRLVGLKEVPGVQCFVPQIFPGRPMEVVGAGARDGHEYSPAVPAIFGAEVARLDTELLQRVRRG